MSTDATEGKTLRTDNRMTILIFIYLVSAHIQISILPRYLNVPKSDIEISLLQILNYVHTRYFDISTSMVFLIMS